MERTVNSKTTKSKIVRIGSIYAVPVINEETLTYWDQQFLVYDHQDPKVIAKKYKYCEEMQDFYVKYSLYYK